MGSLSERRFLRILLLGSFVLVTSISLAQLSGKLKSTFETLQDTVQDDAKYELEDKRLRITYQLPEASKAKFTIVQIVRISATDRREGLVPVSVERQTFEVEWSNVKSIQLDKKATRIQFKKEIQTKVAKLDTLNGTETKSEKAEKELYLFFPKTAQAREATKLFESLRSGVSKYVSRRTKKNQKNCAGRGGGEWRGSKTPLPPSHQMSPNSPFSIIIAICSVTTLFSLTILPSEFIRYPDHFRSSTTTG